MKEALKVGVSGVRGVVGESFTPQIAAGFAQAFGTFVGQGPVLVGRDTRPSGLMLEYAVVAGLQSVGCKPILLGVVPTPTVLLMTKHLGARGGIAITASHNAAKWNALKFADRNGLFLEESRAQELFDVYHQQDFPLVEEAALPSVSSRSRPMDEHVRQVLHYVDTASIRARRFRVAVDCVNGVGAIYSTAFLREQLGCEVVALNDEPTGIFARDPEPLAAHIGALREAVVKNGCDIGFAQDPDGDRLAIVNEKGEPIGEDFTLAFVARQILEAHEKGPVAISLSTSRAVEDVVRAYGCEVVRTAIGETYVVRAMLQARAVVGGEHTGGVIIPKIHPCRDSFGAMALILELLARTGETVSQLRAEIPHYVVVRRKLPTRPERAAEALREIRRLHSGRKMNLMDGLFIEFDQSWAHIRRSNTEPVMRLMVEAPGEARANALIAELESQLTPLLG